MAFSRRPAPLEFGSPSTPTGSSPTPPPTPGFKFWKKAKAAVPLPPKSPTFALSNSPLHPNAQQQQHAGAGGARSPGALSAAGPQSILIRHDAPRPAPLDSQPPAPSKSAMPPSPPPTPATASSSSSSSSSPSQQQPAPSPTPRRKSSSSESLSNRRSGAVFPADLLASASFRSLVSDLPPSPRRPTFPLTTTPITSEFGEQARRASEGTTAPALVSTRRTGAGARSGSPKTSLPAWARVEPPQAVASGSVPASSGGRRFGHGRKRSNSMSNIPLMASSPLAGPSSTPYPTARDDASFEYLPSRPATTLFGSSGGGNRLPTSFGSPASSLPQIQQQQSTRAPPPMRSSRPAAPAVRMANRAPSAMSSPPMATSSPPISTPRPSPPQQESLMSGFPSFVQPQLASFRTLDRLHDATGKLHDRLGRSSSPPPPMPTWPLPVAPTADHPADSLPEVWIIPATPDLGGSSSSSSDTDEAFEEREHDVDGQDHTADASKASDYGDIEAQQAPIALDFGFDFGASLRFGSDDSLSAILSSSSASAVASALENEQYSAVAGRPEQASEATLDEDEQATPKLPVVALIDSPEPIAASTVPAQETDQQEEDVPCDDRRYSAGSDFGGQVVGDGSELDSELARMIASLSVGSLASSESAAIANDELLVAPATRPDDSLLSPAVSAGSAILSPGLGSASLEQFPVPPLASASAIPASSTAAHHGHSHSVPVLSGLGLGLTLNPASSLLLQRRQAAAAEQHESQHGRSASVTSALMTTAPLVRDHRRPFYLASASTPALSFTPRAAAASCAVAPLTPPLTAGALAIVQEQAGQGSPSDCYLPRGETTDDLADLLANSRPGSPSDDDDDEAHGLAYRLAGPSGSFSAATSRSSTLASVSSIPSVSVNRAASGKRSISSTTTASSSACASDFGDDDDEGDVEIARVTETALPVRWAFASSTSGDLLAKTPPLLLPPSQAPTRSLPIPEIEADDDVYAGMAL